MGDTSAGGSNPEPAPGALRRRLGVGDAVVIGLGSMVGAGVFAAYAPAARAAGSGLLLGLVIAAVVAYCNATSSAGLAAVHPQSGGTYVYGRARLGPVWGFMAGWGFVLGKIASCAAIALTFGAYVAPGLARPLAVSAVVALTAVNYLGITKTVALTRVIVVVVLLTLGTVVAAVLAGGQAEATHLGIRAALTVGGAHGTLQAAGLLFFAFAGYARIATLGEEVRDPERTIPRAIPLALGLTVGIYALVAVAALAALGPAGLARADAPLAAAVRAGSFDALAPLVRVGGAVASLGVLLSLLAGIGRTTLAMARDRELPRWLAAVHPRHRVPHRAELAAAVVVVVLVATLDLRTAIGFSSTTVLAYYAITNTAAATLPVSRRRWPRWFAVLGLAGCLILAVNLPPTALAVGAGLLAAGVAGRAIAQRAQRPPE